MGQLLLNVFDLGFQPEPLEWRDLRIEEAGLERGDFAGQLADLLVGAEGHALGRRNAVALDPDTGLRQELVNRAAGAFELQDIVDDPYVVLNAGSGNIGPDDNFKLAAFTIDVHLEGAEVRVAANGHPLVELGGY